MNERANGTRASNGAAPGSAQQPNGVGCPAVDAEVLPPYVEQASGDAAIRIGQVEFNHQTIVRSPCFWLLIGAGLALGAVYLINRRD